MDRYDRMRNSREGTKIWDEEVRKSPRRQKLESIFYGSIAIAFLGFMAYIGYRHYRKDNYYLLPEHSRYTIGNFYHLGGSARSSRYPVFDYYIDGVRYDEATANSTNRLHYLQRQKGGRALVRYSALDHSMATVVDDVWVPSWVIAPPPGGWDVYPPSVKWAGAEIDSVSLKSHQQQAEK